MHRTTTPPRLRTLLTWSSPVLALVLLVGVNSSQTRPPSTTIVAVNDSSSKNDFSAIALSGPLASTIRGEVGGASPSVVVPLGTTRPWILTRPRAVTATLLCARQRHVVSSLVVLAPRPSCQLVLSSAAPTGQSWTLALAP